MHKILLEIAPEAKDRLPKRHAKAAKAPAVEETKERAKSSKAGKESKEKEPEAKAKPMLEKKKASVVEKAE